MNAAFEVEAAAEAGALTARLGLPLESLTAAVTRGPLASGVALTKLAKLADGDDSVDFWPQWALKELDLAAAATGSNTAPVAATIADRWRRLVGQGFGRLDVSASRHGLEDTPPTPRRGELQGVGA